MNPFAQVGRTLSAPLRRYLDTRFNGIERRLDNLDGILARDRLLGIVDVSRHNRNARPPTFDRPTSQVVSAGQFHDEHFERWARHLYPRGGVLSLDNPGSGARRYHRKLWEHVYVLRVAELAGVLEPGRSALGFGVGTEPIPAALAARGLRVIATDREPELSDAWAESAQHMSGINALQYPDIVEGSTLERLVEVRFVDMTDIPGDLGCFDLVWSSGSLEHLGSPEAGLRFVLDTLRLLEPGGIAIHTTELELAPRPVTANYANLAVYQPDDLERVVADARAGGFEVETNWHVSFETPIDRWISAPPHDDREPWHLKLAVGTSILTSVGLWMRRPSASALDTVGAVA